MIVIVDYGRGNLFSIGQALRHLGSEHRISDQADAIRNADRIILPGVGAFGDAMQGLRDRGLATPLRAAAEAGTPILGICVGCQLLLSHGEEFGRHEGLGLIAGTVSRLPDPQDGDRAGIRVPNVGWRALAASRDTSIFGAVKPGQMMYFVHSYAPWPANVGHVSATIAINGQDVPAVIRRDNIVGVQFHPEKSGPVGLAFLAGFLDADIATQNHGHTQMEDA